MEDDIANVQRGLSDIINSIKKYENIRTAIALYGDKNSDFEEWYTYRNFETNLESANTFINDIEMTWGGDDPESVYDGFFQSLKENFWKSENKRMIVLIGDAPPLEKPLSEYSISEVIAQATNDKIIMNFYPIVVSSTQKDQLGGSHEPKVFEKSKILSSFYPNPSKGNLNFNLEIDDNYEVQIFDSNGLLVSKENHSGNNISLELYDLPNGIYIIRVIDSNYKFETMKIMLNK